MILQYFSISGDVLSVKVITDVVTGIPQGYAFVEMKNEEQAHRAVRRLNDTQLNGCKIFVDFECGRSMKGWKPRRLGKLDNIDDITSIHNSQNIS